MITTFSKVLLQFIYRFHSSGHILRNGAATLLLWLLTCLSTAQAIEEQPYVYSLSDIQSGTLLLPEETGDRYLRAPLLDTTVDISVKGMLARTTVEQTFTNDSNRWIEAIYVFPLPDNASVDALTMIIAGNETKGIIQTRKKAQRTYQQAKRAGKKTSLLEQQRGNLFTTRVANIPPGESALIRIGYQNTVRYIDGQFELMFPLTITPRYIPGTAMHYNSNLLESSGGWSLPTDQVEDADQITPPVTTAPSPVSIKVSIDSGLDGLSIASNTHNIITTPLQNQSQEVTLASRTVPADRDFTLTWTPAPMHAPVAAVFRQDTAVLDDTHTFASIMLMPPQEIYSTTQVAREVIFVMDTSGSMGGNSIAQARKALALGIDRLQADDTFNVIEFDSDAHKLFPAAVAASNKNKNIATNWVQQLQADHGTEILGALQLALSAPSHDQRLRQIVFVTDGSVGNEDAIFKYLQNNLGAARLFTVGIGSAPNTWFMRKAAEAGKGSYTTIANANELSSKMMQLLQRLERPTLTDVKLTFDTDEQPEVFPATLPDVYIGEPVLADARWIKAFNGGTVEISGLYAGNPWTQKLRLSSGQNSTSKSSTGLDKLWAYRKIEALENELLFNADHQETENAITKIALNYLLVTKYTSLVAVEQKASRDPSTTPSHSVAIPQAMPAGANMLFPQGSLDTNFKLLLALGFALLSVIFGLASLRQTRLSDNPYRYCNSLLLSSPNTTPEAQRF